MKRNYWMPRSTSSLALVAIAVLSLAGMGAVENWRTDSARPYLTEKLAAAKLARQAMDEIKTIRVERGIEIDPVTDISQSGLIGCAMSSVTSNNGSLSAKQTTVNPNFAAVVVDMLKDAGVQEGDTIAVGFSGSFPAMNICVLAAAETLKLKPIIISSATGSQWGANCPELLWIDMEKELVDRGVFRWRSIAASLGGIEDRAIGTSDEGLKVLSQSIERNDMQFIDPHDYLDSVNHRMAHYRNRAQGAPIKAYVNVGGGTVSVGLKAGKQLFQPGLNRHKPLAPLPADSVMARMIGDDIPVIHLVHIDDLAAAYGLPVQPAEIPRVGEGDVYAPRIYNKFLASGLLAAIVASLAAAVRAQTRLQTTVSGSVQTRRSTTSLPREEAESMPL